MQHQQLVRDFLHQGIGGKGTYMEADQDALYSKFPAYYRGSYRLAGRKLPLAVRLGDGGVLVNGARLEWPMARHQRLILDSLQSDSGPFGVVPYHSVVAALTQGAVRNWDEKPIPPKELRREVGIVVPSAGERWEHVTVKDKHGKPQTRLVHTLGDSVVRVHDRFYLSAVDETGQGAGMYFLAELHTDRAPATLQDAMNVLKPQIVLDAEARGANVRRQGEWFAIPTNLLTSALMRDVERGIAVYRERHVLGRDGHHQLEEAVIYRAGSHKGEVYARGVLAHVNDEHVDLDLGFRWHRVVHNIQGASYTLSGSGAMAMFD